MSIDADALLEQLASEARTLVNENGTPGVALGVLVGDEVRTLGLGVTNVEHPLPVDETTIFQVASISKLFLALAAVRLAEQGVLDLDSPVRRWLPGLELDDESVAERLTLRQLLTHRGGFEGDYLADTGRGDDALERLLPLVRDAPQRTVLGEPHYSNLGFVLAGHVLAVATGAAFEDVVREQVFEPLGLERTHYFLEALAHERLAAGHRIAPGGPELTGWERPRARGPNGGVLSCVHDLLRFARFHLGDGKAHDGTSALTAASLGSQLSPQGPGGSMADDVGLGWMLRDHGGVALAGHDGASTGFRSDLWIAPEHGAAFVQLTNADRGRNNVERLLVRFARALGGDPKTPESSGLEIESLARRYFSRWGGLISIRPSNDGLQLRWWGDDPDPLVSRIVVTGADRFEAIDEPLRGVRADVLRDDAGEIEWLRIGGRLLRPYADGAPIPELDELLRQRG